jgi:hypothetical protein
MTVIREPEFAKRLIQACDAHNHVPPLHGGRLTWIARELLARYDEQTSVESVRKWFAGENKPRADKLSKLAQLLEVDEAWLSIGVDPEMTPRERVVRNAMADGAVNVIAGMIQMDGGYPAFPEGNVADGIVDLHAIIRGGKYDIHVSHGEEVEGGLRFVVPKTDESVVILGVIREGFAFRVYDLSPEVIATYHQRNVGSAQQRGLAVEILVPKNDPTLRRIDSFKQRL